MKKLSILLFGMLGLIVSSCDDGDIAPAIPQQNPQEPIVSLENVTSQTTGALASASVLSLESYRGEGATIPVMELVKTDSLPTGATISYKLQLSNTDDFSREVTLATIAGEPSESGSIVYSVDAASWNDAHLYLFGKSPKEKVAYYRVPAYINIDGSDYRLNGTDYYVAQGSLTETCMDSGFVIEDYYYLLSDATTWDLSAEGVKGYAFEHSEDVSVYDDPVFTYKLKITQDVLDAHSGAVYWKIAPQSSADNADWGTVLGPEVNGDESEEGVLISENAQAGKLTVAGNYVFTINMETMNYDIELKLQPDVLYTPGGANGWNQLDSGWLQLHKDDNGGFYYGLFLVDNNFKICAENSWDDSTTYGAESDAPSLGGKLVQPGSNITVADAGVYWVKVNYDALSYVLTDYELTSVETVGVIGSFPASGWGSDVIMETADNGMNWTAEVSFDAGNEFKFRFNGNWDYNLGGAEGDLIFNGDNIKVEEAGDYVITLSLQPGVPSCTVVKK